MVYVRVIEKLSVDIKISNWVLDAVVFLLKKTSCIRNQNGRYFRDYKHNDWCWMSSDCIFDVESYGGDTQV